MRRVGETTFLLSYKEKDCLHNNVLVKSYRTNATEADRVLGREFFSGLRRRSHDYIRKALTMLELLKSWYSP